MAWIDPEGNKHNKLPNRIRLNDKTTRTSDAVTEELALAAGWTKEVIQEQITIVSDAVFEKPIILDANYTDTILLNSTDNIVLNTPDFNMTSNVSL